MDRVDLRGSVWITWHRNKTSRKVEHSIQYSVCSLTEYVVSHLKSARLAVAEKMQAMKTKWGRIFQVSRISGSRRFAVEYALGECFCCG